MIAGWVSCFPGTAFAGLLAIDIGSFPDTATLYSVDPTNADLTFIGDTGLDALGALEFAPDGTLYGFTTSFPESLFSIDPGNGAPTFIGELGGTLTGEGGLAFSPVGTAYGVNGNSNENPELFSIDLNSGVKTTIGQMGNNRDINGLAWRSDGVLVGIDNNENALVSIDPNTAAIATIVSLGFNVGSVGGMTTDHATGVSYFATGVEDEVGGVPVPGTNGLYRFDLFTGAETFIGNFAAEDPVGISGLAGTPIPEPGTSGLLALGLASLAARGRRGRS